jgi:hypothetical protein
MLSFGHGLLPFTLGSWPLRIQFRRYDSLNFLRRFNAATLMSISAATATGVPITIPAPEPNYRTGNTFAPGQPEVNFGVPKMGEGLYSGTYTTCGLARPMRFVRGGSCIMLFCGCRLENSPQIWHHAYFL